MDLLAGVVLTHVLHPGVPQSRHTLERFSVSVGRGVRVRPLPSSLWAPVCVWGGGKGEAAELWKGGGDYLRTALTL